MKNGEKNNDPAKVLLLIGLVCLLIFPAILSTTWGFIEFDDATGVIGDTIGGITAPISGFLGATLVYLALRSRYKQTK